jgi:hypothetical protein
LSVSCAFFRAARWPTIKIRIHYLWIPKGGGKKALLSQPTGRKTARNHRSTRKSWTESILRWRKSCRGRVHHPSTRCLSPLGGYPEMTMMEESYKKNGLVKKCSKISSRPTIFAKIVMVKWVLFFEVGLPIWWR